MLFTDASDMADRARRIAYDETYVAVRAAMRAYTQLSEDELYDMSSNIAAQAAASVRRYVLELLLAEKEV